MMDWLPSIHRLILDLGEKRPANFQFWRKIMSKSSKRSCWIIATALLMLVGTSQFSVAQDGGREFPIDPGTGGGGVPATPTDPISPPTTDNGTDNNTGGGTGGTAAGDTDLEQVQPVRIIREIEDRRNQGFVGSTAAVSVEQGFVGPQGSDTALPIGDGRSFGGGTNGTGGGGGGGGGGGNAGGGQNVGGQGTATTNGFTVVRRSVRARLSPQFTSRSLNDNAAQSRFLSHVYRQPAIQTLSPGLSVQFVGETAIISGVTASAADAERLVRQLRLEPGVYKIENQATVSQQ